MTALLWLCLATMGVGSAAAAEADATCLACHRGLSAAAVEALQASPHRSREEGTGPPAPGCVTCHGASNKHLQGPGKGERGADVQFGDAPHASPVEQQNAPCLGCHQGREQMHWPGSPHEKAELKCVDCHRIHQAKPDAAADKQAAVQACTRCHLQQGAELHFASAHPLRDGQMSCSDCHNPHGESASGTAVLGLANDSCLRCHADKRGPFLWEHPPASEDCGQCHRPHGSPHPALLTARAPWLCQQCHLAQFHPSALYSGTGLPTDTRPSGAQSLLARNCMNCHPQVHGSNHPSGSRLTR
ncbi:DmsE family decaheme c-type cytochrome [Pseudoxanthomonas sp. CAU 1598]|uniref:DmsE family decaheme c-type cytochrome n=2 Tax=Pseudomarimonas arenosa TaxID=2774145 RepID=A0AAW3ZJ46_9GAMM|nr:DmsE family decaheme c-type cytochrome [Pseudomarimonas arenosa]